MRSERAAVRIFSNFAKEDIHMARGLEDSANTKNGNTDLT